MAWVREYNAQNLSLEELADRIAGHDFRKRKGEKQEPNMARALEYKDADYEEGTFDEVYRAQAFGLLTRKDMDVILDRVQQSEETDDTSEPNFVCQTASSPAQATLIELPASSEPHLIKVDDGFIKIKVTG